MLMNHDKILCESCETKMWKMKKCNIKRIKQVKSLFTYHVMETWDQETIQQQKRNAIRQKKNKCI